MVYSRLWKEEWLTFLEKEQEQANLYEGVQERNVGEYKEIESVV